MVFSPLDPIGKSFVIRLIYDGIHNIPFESITRMLIARIFQMNQLLNGYFNVIIIIIVIDVVVRQTEFFILVISHKAICVSLFPTSGVIVSYGFYVVTRNFVL